MRGTTRLVGSTVLALLVALGMGSPAHAQTASCSRTQLAPGQALSVSGGGAVPGESAFLLFNGSTIGAATVDGFGNFTISGTVPATTPPGTYQVSVAFGVSPTIFPCTVTVQQAPPPPPPTPPTPTPTPTATPDDTPRPRDDDDRAPAQQQQQQQQGGGPFGQGGQQQQAGGAGQQQQQQQQQVVIPVAHVPHGYVGGGGGSGGGGGKSLPATGLAVEAGLGFEDMLGGSVGSLLIGLSLVQLTRRRLRRPARTGSGEGSAPTLSEADLLLPRWD